MTPRSNLHGRVLEYLIVEGIIKLQPKTTLTPRAKSSQSRDISKLIDIDATLLQELNGATDAFLTKWFEPKFHVSTQFSAEIDRLPDQNRTDVTDVRVTLPQEVINLSIKHNHTALRHQRPRTTPIHCGFSKLCFETQEFQQKYKAVTQSFMRQSGEEKLFSNLSHGLKEKTLYTPICDLVSQFINTHSKVCASSLFTYLIGSKDYYKIIVDTRAKQLKIQQFTSIPLPTTLTSIVNKQPVEIMFNNGWQISMRLHNASSRIGTSPSLKFDTKVLKDSIPSTIVFYL